MSTFQIIGFIMLGIVVLIFIIGHVSMYNDWKQIKVGDTGIYQDNHDGWHNLPCYIEVVEKRDDCIVIKFGDNSKETVWKHEYINHDKIFKWDKYGETN